MREVLARGQSQLLLNVTNVRHLERTRSDPVIVGRRSLDAAAPLPADAPQGAAQVNDAALSGSPPADFAYLGHGQSGRARLGLQEGGISGFAGFTEAMIMSGALPFSTQSIRALSASNFSSATPPSQCVRPGTANRRAKKWRDRRFRVQLSNQRIVSLIEKTGSAWP